MNEISPPVPGYFQQLRSRLADEFPNAITRKGTAKKPLAIKAREAMIARCPWLTPVEVRNFLNWYTRRTSYLRAMQKTGAMRVDLDGIPVEPVSDDHKKHAAFVLQRAIEKKERYEARQAARRAKMEAAAS